jgi:hypothetical protein
LGALGAEMQATGELEGQMRETIERAAAQPPSPGIPAAPGIGQLSPEMRETMARNAKMALQFTTDPAQRKLLIEQFRVAGIPLDDEDLQQ